ncbi:HEAT repeat family protein [Tritrichomonas foetus]|uniref:HEAT repeat family protein n=1 Tax=Tritrichomonas foetus TaxID=1144522 RepID=A0A1J4J4W2_9EUKA|nr:HEAT repeat family protein [Tritrichomonas foetus]|eukprot:OHS94360.1 HEAT repeat family protein [Tritrichomonas foetus]
MTDDYDVDEIRTLITNIRSPERNVRLSALANLHVIAQVLGPERTENELIPFTMDTTDHFDECYIKIAKVLYKLMDKVNSIKIIIKSLKTICEKEDQKIRGTGIKTLMRIGRKISDDVFDEIFQSFIFSVCEDSWYPLRCTGANLLCMFYRKIPKADYKKSNYLLIGLSTDKNVIVRKNLATSLPILIKYSVGSRSTTEISLKLLKNLGNDTAAAVLIEIPQSIALIAPNNPDLAIEISSAVFKSNCWQAKSVLISFLDQICLSKSKAALKFIRNVADSSVQDMNDVIRSSIARQIPFIYKSNCFGDEDEFQQFSTTLITDTQKEVRISAAESLGNMKEDAPYFLEAALGALLNDDEVDVKIAALKSVATSGNAVDSATSSLEEITQSKNWRERKSIAELLPKIALSMNDEDFDEQVGNTLKLLFCDEADDVRRATINSIAFLIKKFGQEWMNKTVVGLIKKTYQDNDYMLRKTAIEAIIKLRLKNECIDVLKAATKDPISNVRLVLARDLKRPSHILQKLAKDPDPDVAYFASLP